MIKNSKIPIHVNDVKGSKIPSHPAKFSDFPPYRRPVFRIRDVLIRIRICGSAPLDYGSGYSFSDFQSNLFLIRHKKYNQDFLGLLIRETDTLAACFLTVKAIKCFFQGCGSRFLRISMHLSCWIRIGIRTTDPNSGQQCSRREHLYLHEQTAGRDAVMPCSCRCWNWRRQYWKQYPHSKFLKFWGASVCLTVRYGSSFPPCLLITLVER